MPLPLPVEAPPSIEVAVPASPFAVDGSRHDALLLRTDLGRGTREVAWILQSQVDADGEVQIRSQSRVTNRSTRVRKGWDVVQTAVPLASEAVYHFERRVPTTVPVASTTFHLDARGRTTAPEASGSNLGGVALDLAQGVVSHVGPGWPEGRVAPGDAWSDDKVTRTPLDMGERKGTLVLQTRTTCTFEGWTAEGLVVLAVDVDLQGRGLVADDDGSTAFGIVGGGAGRLVLDPETAETVWGANRVRLATAVGWLDDDPSIIVATVGMGRVGSASP